MKPAFLNKQWIIVLAAAVWVLSAALIVSYGLWLAPSLDSHIQHAQQQQQQLQEQLTLGKSAQKEQTKQTIQKCLEDNLMWVGCFSTPEPQRSSLIFKVGQLASVLGLKDFVSQLPSSIPDPTLPNSAALQEGWLSISFKSDFLTAATFVNTLERDQPVMFVETISLQGDDQNPDWVEVRMLLSYLVQTRPPTQAVAGRF